MEVLYIDFRCKKRRLQAIGQDFFCFITSKSDWFITLNISYDGLTLELINHKFME